MRRCSVGDRASGSSVPLGSEIATSRHPHRSSIAIIAAAPLAGNAASALPLVFALPCRGVLEYVVCNRLGRSDFGDQYASAFGLIGDLGNRFLHPCVRFDVHAC